LRTQPAGPGPLHRLLGALRRDRGERAG
jgi:hypothetical protein